MVKHIKKLMIFLTTFFLSLNLLSVLALEPCPDIITSCCKITQLNKIYFLGGDIIANESPCIFVEPSGESAIILCEKYKIVGNGSGIGIQIANFTPGVGIIDCVIQNFTQGIRVGIGSGSTLITKSIISNNYVGIYLDWSVKPDYPAKWNWIASNIIVNNSLGIRITYGWDNTIVNNYFKNFYHDSYDDYGINRYNLSKTLQTNIIGGPYRGGNYWYTYTGMDLDNDGIGDIPHIVNPIPPNRDYLPLVDIISPKYSEIHGPTGLLPYSPSATYEFKITWKDNTGIDKVIFEFDGINYTLNATQEYIGFNQAYIVEHTGNYSISFSNLGLGTHYYRWYANDTRNNWNITDLISFTLKDLTPPYYSNITEPKDPSIYNPSATYTFKIEWFDDVEVERVIFEMDGKNYTPSRDGNTYTFTFSSCPTSSRPPSGGGGSYKICMMSLSPFSLFEYILDLILGKKVKAEELPCLGIGIHYYRWYASDTENNWNFTELLNFTIRPDPLIIHVISPQNTTYSTQNISISYVIENGDALHWIAYSLDDGPNITLSGNTSIIVSEGTHKIKFYANNSYGISNSSSEIYFTVLLPKPDLVIEDIWTYGSTIYYRVRNKGNAASTYSYSKLFVDNYYKSLDYVPSLNPNSSTNEYFSYSWYCTGVSNILKVCADSYDYVKESDETNNCLTKIISCSNQTCTCSNWEPALECCYYSISSKQLWRRTCFPRGCAPESKCEGPCFAYI